MKVICQNCNATYAINDAAIPPKGARAQCPRCKHLQAVKREEGPAAAGAAPPPAAGAAPPPAARAAPAADPFAGLGAAPPPPAARPPSGAADPFAGMGAAPPPPAARGPAAAPAGGDPFGSMDVGPGGDPFAS